MMRQAMMRLTAMALQPVGGAVGEELHPAAGIPHPKKVLHPPPLEIVADHLGGGLARFTRFNRQAGAESSHSAARRSEPLGTCGSIKNLCRLSIDWTPQFRFSVFGFIEEDAHQERRNDRLVAMTTASGMRSVAAMSNGSGRSWCGWAP